MSALRELTFVMKMQNVTIQMEIMYVHAIQDFLAMAQRIIAKVKNVSQFIVWNLTLFSSLCEKN